MNLNIKSYPGAKTGSGVMQLLMNNIPEHSVFVDMCAGSGAVGFTVNELCSSTVVLCEKYQPVFNQLILKSTSIPIKNKFEKIYVKHIDSIEFYYDRVLDNSNNFDETFFYLDPPYLKTTRRDQKNIYGCEWSEKDHCRMLTLANLISKYTMANIMINHYDCQLYREYLRGWETKEYKTMTRGGIATDKIWMNYDITKLNLAVTDFVGDDFKDRQRIKRRKISFLNKFKNMPIHERQSILQYIQKHL
jgi:site-specific DNA-adenine methylase